MQERYAGERLVAEFEGIFSRETVMECLKDTAKRWVDAPVQTFVELLAERFARESLRAAARA
jgi:arsenate reductase